MAFYQEDWLMRQILSTTEAIARVIFGKTDADYVEDGEFAETDELHSRLLKLLDERRINEAENLLYEQADPDDIACLLVATDFYSRLGRMKEAELEESDFSLEEVQSGLEDFAGRYGVLFFQDDPAAPGWP